MFNGNVYSSKESKLNTPWSKQIIVFPLAFIKAVRINKYSKDSVCSTAPDTQKQMISTKENY